MGGFHCYGHKVGLGLGAGGGRGSGVGAGRWTRDGRGRQGMGGRWVCWSGGGQVAAGEPIICKKYDFIYFIFRRPPSLYK